MNTTQKGILALLKSAVTETGQPLPDGFDIEAALPQIRRHHITAPAFDGAVRCGISRQDPAMQELFRSYCKALLVSEGQMRELGRVFTAFEEHSIDYLPVKGCRMKDCYPKPELRLMGDADVLIREEQREKISCVMRELGFAEKEDTDHEWVWTNDSLYLELHKRLIPSYNEDYYAYFGDGWRLAKEKNGACHSMTAEDELLYLFTHFAKHYRDGGVGCRYVVDLWVYLRTRPDLDETYLRAELEKLRLLEFYENIRRLIAVWFEDAPTDEKSDYLTEYIFASGSWGEMESRTLSRAVRDSKHSALGFNGKLLYLWQTAFPGIEILRGKYTVLKKAPWLLPVIWLIRPFYKIFFERETLEKQRRNLNAVRQENMDDRRRMLRYVGLDYHF